MKYWDRALRALRSGDGTFSAIYSIAFSFSENVFFEWSAEGRLHSMTYHDCRLRVSAAAARIAAALDGVPQNAFVALWLNNSPAWVIAFWAILMAGYRPLLINARLNDEQNSALLDMARARGIVSDKPFLDYRFIDALDFEAPPPPSMDFSPRWADQIALCSSGTAGLPKLCVYDGRAICAQIHGSLHVIRTNPTIETYYRGQLKLLAFLPFYHVFGLVANLLWFSFFGRSFVFPRDMSAAAIAEACKRYGVTHVFAIPLLFDALAVELRKKAGEMGQAERLERALRFSMRLQTMFPRSGARLARGLFMRGLRQRVLGPSVRFCITGGGPVGTDALYVCNALGYSLYNGYGMTEIGIASVELRLRAKDRLLGSVGRPLPPAEYRIDDGELFARGDSFFTAMIEDGRELPRDPLAWFATGDMARVDAEGFYYVDGRLDDLIVTGGGENLLPDALERHFQLEHARRVCIIGLRDEKTADPVVTLIIEPEPNLSPLLLDRLIRKAFDTNRALPLREQAGRILIADEPLPVTLEGKARRRETRIRLAQGSFACHEARPRLADEAAASAEYAEALGGIRALFAEVLARAPEEIGEDAHLVHDLGCGSLQYFALAARIAEEYHVSFDPSGDAPRATPREFAEYVLRGG